MEISFGAVGQWQTSPWGCLRQTSHDNSLFSEFKGVCIAQGDQYQSSQIRLVCLETHGKTALRVDFSCTSSISLKSGDHSLAKSLATINILTHQSLLSTVAGSCVWSLISFFARLLRPIFFLKCWYGQTRSWFLDKSKLDRKLAASALKKMAVSARTLPILGCFGQSWAKPGCFGQITGCFGNFFFSWFR